MMGFATRKRSLPFRVSKKSISNGWISFAEFEADYLARLEKEGEQETEDVDSAKLEKESEQETEDSESLETSSKMSASRRAWNLVYYLPKATTIAAATCKSKIRMKFDAARLDRMPEIETGIVHRMASVIEPRVTDLQGMNQVSQRLSVSESSIETTSISEETTMSNVRPNSEILRNNSSIENQFHRGTCSDTVPCSFDSSSIFAPQSPAKLSRNSFTQSDIQNAVQRVCSDELKFSPINLSSKDLKRSYFGIGNPRGRPIESPEPSSQDLSSQRFNSPMRSDTRSQASSAEFDSNGTLPCKLERDTSAPSEATRLEVEKSENHGDEKPLPDLHGDEKSDANIKGDLEPVVDISPSLRKDVTNVSSTTERSAEEKLAERIVIQKKLFARKKIHKAAARHSS